MVESVLNDNSDVKNESNISESNSNVQEDRSTVNDSESLDDLNTVKNSVKSGNYTSNNTDVKSKLFKFD
jgi:hypothetical protein